MAKRNKTSDKAYLLQWQKFKDNISKATPIDLNEAPLEKNKRIKRLEANDEEWFRYYFPNFYTSEPALFHKKATKRVIENPEYYEVRPWARELAKSARTMMEVLYLTLTGKKKNILLVSNNLDNAERLLLPYKTNLEANNRIINDYGKQENIGKWEAGEFVTTKGVAFRALGAGQSPRGTRNAAARPDVILIDDIDTDEECRNKDRIKAKVNWVEEALIPTRSISNPLLIIVCGNIIARFCTVTELMKKADYSKIVNIRDKDGKSTWLAKNTEEAIDRVLSSISNRSAQKEYFNNPQTDGDVFKEIYYDKCPKLSTCEKVIVYGDPSPSNNTRSKSSKKAVVIIGYKELNYYIYRVWLDNTTNSVFIDWLWEACKFLDQEKVDPKRIYVENNSLQNPFYEQVLIPLINRLAKTEKYKIPIRPDKRRKPDKFTRVEGTLEPKNRLRNLIFNITRKEDPHMKRLEEEALAISENSKEMDGMDAVEGGVWLIDHRVTKADVSYAFGAIENRHY